jgi:hypothetical protein
MSGRLYFAYARHALVVALRMAGVRTGDTVLLPDLICRDVLASIRAVGAEPAFYPIGSDLQISKDAQLPPARALLAVNYFGFPADLDRVASALHDPDTLVIEDNAHGWLSATPDGQLLGSRTALGITSFRKTIRSPDGAFLEWNSDNSQLVVNGHLEVLQPRTEPLTTGFILRRVVSRSETLIRIPLFPIARSSVRALRGLASRPVLDLRPEDEFTLPAQVPIHQRSLDYFRRCDPEREITRRRNLYLRCEQLAVMRGVQPVFPELPKGVSPQGFPYYRDSGDASAFERTATRRRLGEPMSWPTLPSISPLAHDSPLSDIQVVNFLV